MVELEIDPGRSLSRVFDQRLKMVLVIYMEETLIAVVLVMLVLVMLVLVILVLVMLVLLLRMVMVVVMRERLGGTWKARSSDLEIAARMI